jgi:hypothetical protein
VSAAADLTRYPLVGEFRLVDVIASGPALPVPETTSTENTMEAVIFMNWVAQNSQPSEVVVGSKFELGQEFGRIFANRRKVSFEVLDSERSG